MTGLLTQRNIDKEAKLYHAKQGGILSNLEREDKYATKIEAGSKVFYNTMTMAATILLFVGGAFLSAPMWLLGLGMGIFAASFIGQTTGTIIETNRNQSQSDSIARALHKKLKQGISIGNLEGKRSVSTHAEGVNNVSGDVVKAKGQQKDIFNQLVSAKTHEELDNALEKTIKADRRNTVAEQILKCITALTYVTAFAILSAGFTYLSLSSEVVLGISSGSFAISFVTFAAGSYIESNRNKNQTSGLRRLAISELNLDQQKMDEVNLLAIKETKDPQESIVTEPVAPDVKGQYYWRDKSQLSAGLSNHYSDFAISRG